MRNQILTTFFILTFISTYIVIGPNNEQIGSTKQNQNEEIKIKKINVFKWTTNKDYRRNLIKRINDKL